MRSRLSAAFLLALAGAISVSCGGIVDPSANQTQTFSGTLQPTANSQQKFSSGSGEISVKVGTLTPAAAQFIGIQWVQQAGDGSCTGGLFGNQVTPANTTAISSRINSGNYCIVIYDPVGYSQPVTYSVTLSHP